MSRPTTLTERTRAVAVAMIQWDFLRACVSKVDACHNNPCCRSGRGPSESWTEQHLRAWGFGRDQRREDAEDQAKSSGAKSRRRRRTKRLAQEFTNDIWTEQALPDRTTAITRRRWVILPFLIRAPIAARCASHGSLRSFSSHVDRAVSGEETR